jgi:hypothetical protein
MMIATANDNKFKCLVAFLEYGATGEGMTIIVEIQKYGHLAKHVEDFVKKHGEYFARGASFYDEPRQIPEKDWQFLEAILPKHVFNSLGRFKDGVNDAGNLEFSSKFHVNYS